jgi:2-C-methyl-D-erythritol 4-phosphate cytidylyltransferase
MRSYVPHFARCEKELCLTFITAILLAGGVGKRMNHPIPKQFLPLNGKEVALYSFETLLSIPEIQEIVVVCEPSYQHLFNKETHKVKFASPGKERHLSVWNGVMFASPKAEFVLVHDSARPFVTQEHILELIKEVKIHGAVASAVPVKATIKQANSHGFVEHTLDRSRLWEMHTPQLMRVSLLQQGLKTAQLKKLTLTDDIAAAELLGHPAKLILGSYRNIKITTPEDLHIAKIFLIPHA